MASIRQKCQLSTEEEDACSVVVEVTKSTGCGFDGLNGHTDSVQSVAFSWDGQRLASASADNTVKVWDAATGQESLTLKGHTSEVNSVAFSLDGKRLASASTDKTVKVWDVTPRAE